MTDYFAQLEQARANGAEYARNGIAAGFTEPEDSPLSGEWADGLQPIDVVAMACNLTTEEARELTNGDEWIVTDFCDAWEDGYLSQY